MTTIIHEYSINLGPGGIGPWLRLSYWVYEKKTKQEVNEYIKAKINEPNPTVIILDTKREKTTFVLQRNRHGKRQLMRLFGEEDAILAAQVISCMPITKSNLIETINQKVHQRLKSQDFFPPEEKKEIDDCIPF